MMDQPVITPVHYPSECMTGRFCAVERTQRALLGALGPGGVD